MKKKLCKVGNKRETNLPYNVVTGTIEPLSHQ